MPRLYPLSYVFGGARALLADTIPHFVSGVVGRPFQTPSAKPRGEGRSLSPANLLWGFANLVIFSLLMFRVGDFDLRNAVHAAALGLGMLPLGLGLVRRFGRFNGGNALERP